MRATTTRIKPSAVRSLIIEERWVTLTLASGHCLRFSSRGAVTVIDGKPVEGLQCSVEDVEQAVSVTGSVLRDNKGADWVGYVECPLCHEWHKSGRGCLCSDKADAARKQLEGVKPA